MKAIPSNITLQNFAVLQSHYDFIQPSKKIKDINKVFQSYEIDIDFTHHFEEDGTFQVFVKINVNDVDKSLPGYKLKVEGAGIFQLTEENLSDNEKNNLKFYSSVSIIIGYLRNTLTMLTSSGPFESYTLPPIDLPDLFKKKSKKSEE